MELTEILSTLKQLGITAQANGGKLVLTPGSMVPPDLVPVIQEHKAEFIALLAECVSVSRLCPLPIRKARLTNIAGLRAGVPPAEGAGGAPLRSDGRTIWNLSIEEGNNDQPHEHTSREQPCQT
jgi:hypothetical protein